MVLGLSACGGDAEPAPSADAAPVDVAPEAGSGADTDAGADASSGPSDVCSSVTGADIDAIVGGTTTVAMDPSGGCVFSQDDPRAPSVALAASAYDEENGGFEAASFGVTSVIEGEATSVDLGDEAFLVVGPSLGGDNEQGGGLIRVGGTLVQVTIIQGNGLSTPVVTGLLTDVLALVADRA